MNYATHYESLIERARGRILSGYRERHHVVPRCLRGSDAPDNLVYLTPEEHYVAHQLLVKMHPRHGRLVHAAVLMSTRCGSNKAYGWLKRRHISQLTVNMLGNQHTVGYTHTADAKAKIAAPHRGQKRSETTKSRMSASMRGNTNARGKTLPPFTDAHREKLAAAKRGKPGNRSGSPTSDATRDKLRAAHAVGLPKVKPDRSYHFSDAHKAKIANSLRGIKRAPPTQEHRDKLSAAMRSYWSGRNKE